MYTGDDSFARKQARKNAFSVIGKLFVGTTVIMIVGVCAYLVLIALMNLI